jgi:hypothetical protein
MTPKNWASFQHYKDRSPAWIKLHRSILDDFEFACLPVASRALAPLLWLLASEYEGGKITASLDALAFRLRMPKQDFVVAAKPLIDIGFFVDDSAMLAGCKHDASPEKKEEKEKQDKREEDSRSVAKATRPTDEFLEFWKAYPKRQGSNPRKPAFEKWQRLVKSGIDPGKITAAVKAGAGFDGKKVGTEFIPQAIKWLNDQRFDDYEPPSEAARSQAYVRKDSPHWEHLARRWRQENKKEFGPPARDGWAFPIEWIPPSANGAAA